MQSNDPIADFLTRVRNAIAVNQNQIELPIVKQVETVARVLKSAGYLADVKTEKPEKGAPRGKLLVKINEDGTNSVINEVHRVSKPGRRVYAKYSEIPRYKSGRGIYLVSTSKGVMTSREAVNAKLGGELLAKVY
jgi:small subunit ribosomal protein S8